MSYARFLLPLPLWLCPILASAQNCLVVTYPEDRYMTNGNLYQNQKGIILVQTGSYFQEYAPNHTWVRQWHLPGDKSRLCDMGEGYLAGSSASISTSGTTASWLYFHRLDYNGNALRRQALEADPDNAGEVALTGFDVSPGRDTIFMASRRTLYQIDTTGKMLQTHRFAPGFLAEIIHAARLPNGWHMALVLDPNAVAASKKYTFYVLDNNLMPQQTVPFPSFTVHPNYTLHVSDVLPDGSWMVLGTEWSTGITPAMPVLTYLFNVDQQGKIRWKNPLHNGAQHISYMQKELWCFGNIGGDEPITRLDLMGNRFGEVAISPLSPDHTGFRKSILIDNGKTAVLAGGQVFGAVTTNNYQYNNILVWLGCDPTSSVETAGHSEHVNILPNPNSGHFTVALSQPASINTRFRVTDLAGHLLLEQTAQPGAARQTVDAHALPSGMYFLSVLEEGRIHGAVRFVKADQ